MFVYLISEFHCSKMYVGTTSGQSHVMSVCPVEESILSLSVLQPPLCCAGSPCVGWTSKNLVHLLDLYHWFWIIVKSVILMLELICVCYILFWRFSEPKSRPLPQASGYILPLRWSVPTDTATATYVWHCLIDVEADQRQQKKPLSTPRHCGEDGVFMEGRLRGEMYM